MSTDLPAFEVPPDFYTRAQNVVFRRSLAERAPSRRYAYDPMLGPAYALLNAQFAGTNFWLYQAGQNSYVVEGANHSDITEVSGLTNAPASYFHSLISLNGIPVLNNTFDIPMYWGGDPAIPFAQLPGWDAGLRAEVMVPYRFHLFAMNLSGAQDLPSDIVWSDAAAPGNVPATWQATAANEAGGASLSQTGGEIVTGESLRGSLMIYKNGSTYVVDYIGRNQGGDTSDQIFSVRPVFVQSGALTRHSVADINGRHFVVTDGDVILHDGVTTASIVQNRRRSTLFGSLDQTNYRKLFVVYYRAKNEVWLCFPESGADLCTRAMVYDVANDSWGDRELNNVSFGATGIVNDSVPSLIWDDLPNVTWDDYIGRWNDSNFSLATQALLLAEPSTSQVACIDKGDQTLSSVVARDGLDFGAPDRYKTVKRVYFRVTAESDVKFELRVGSQEFQDGPTAWSDAVIVNSQSGYADFIVAGRFLSFEARCTTNKTFTAAGFDVEYELRGYF